MENLNTISKDFKSGYYFEKKVTDDYAKKCVRFSKKLQKLVEKEGLTYFRFTYMTKEVKNNEGKPIDKEFMVSDVLDINSNVLFSYCI